MKHSIVARILLSLLGLALILYGSGSLVLGVIGERDTAIITSVRRQGGERDEMIRGRYTYSIGYTFTLPDGREINGTSTLVGNAVYTKADGTSTILVRYLKQAPFVNIPEEDTKLTIGQPLLVAAGFFLINAMRQKRLIQKEEDHND